MDPVSLIVAAVVNVGKTLDVSLLGWLRGLTRDICIQHAGWRDHRNPLCRIAGQMAAYAAEKSESDRDCRRRFYEQLRQRQEELQTLVGEKVRADNVWQFEVSQDLARIQGNVSMVLLQLAEVRQATNEALPARIERFIQNLTDQLKLPELCERLDEIHELLTLGLDYPATAWSRYWDRMRDAIPWRELDRAGREAVAYTVITSFVGRADELARFERFLVGDGKAQVLHLLGEPGTGKSRLLHECAAQAERLNWAVRFMNDSVNREGLGRALQETHKELVRVEPAGLLLIWDDWQDGNEDALKLFLKPRADLHAVPRGLPVKRIISTWPTFRRAVEKHADRHAPREQFDLQPLDPVAAEVVELLRNLGLSEDQARKVTQVSEGHPMAMILGTDLVLGGKPLSELSSKGQIVAASYDKWLDRLEVDRPFADDAAAYAADLRQVALLGALREEEVDRLGDIAGYRNPKDAGLRLRELARVGYLRQDADSAAYRIPHDLLRRHIAGRALLRDVEDVYYGFRDLAEVAAHLLPFARPANLWAVYSLLVQGEEDAFGNLRLEFANRVVEWQGAQGQSLERERRFAMLVAGLTSIEPLLNTRLRIANLVERIADRRKCDREIDLSWAKALHNVAALDPGPTWRYYIAMSVQRIATSHYPPDREIDHVWALARLNMTVFERDKLKREEIARSIGGISARHAPPDRKINLGWADALLNATSVQEDPRERERIACLIESIAGQHNPPDSDIDLAWAQALFNAAVAHMSPEERERIAALIGQIDGRHDPPAPSINETWALAIAWASLGYGDPHERAQFAARTPREIMSRWEGDPHYEGNLRILKAKQRDL